jgi:four helix bundle protein
MKVEKFEDIIAWKRVGELTRTIYQITSAGKISKDFGLCDQIRRASVSVMVKCCGGL